MQRGSERGGVATFFAPAERDSPAEVQAERATIMANEAAVAMLAGIPDPALVLNGRRQILAANQRVLTDLGLDHPEDVFGLRPGEALACIHASEGPGGCGTSESCALCGAVDAIISALRTRGSAIRECRLCTSTQAGGGAVDALVQATCVDFGATEVLLMVVLRDISAEKRREVLERVFFHDVLNTAGGISAIAWLLGGGNEDPAAEAEYKQDLIQLSEQITDEISGQRLLLAAERGALTPTLEDVAIPELLEAVLGLYRHHSVARNRILQLGHVSSAHLQTDVTLLKRVLGNLVKNALEATPAGGMVTIEAEDRGQEVAFIVRNPGVMPSDVQKQIFQRSFTTKGGSGRGIGTHSVKLLTERHLKGQVGFISREPEGTVFTVTLPRALSAV